MRNIDIAQTPSNDQMWGAGLQCLPLNPSSPTDIALSSVWVMGNPTKPASDICSPDHAAYPPAIGSCQPSLPSEASPICFHRFQGLGPGGSIPVEFHMHHHHHHYVANQSTGSPSPYVTESGSPNFLSSTNNLNYHSGNSGSRSPFAPVGIGGTAGGTSFCKLHGAVLQGQGLQKDKCLSSEKNGFLLEKQNKAQECIDSTIDAQSPVERIVSNPISKERQYRAYMKRRNRKLAAKDADMRIKKFQSSTLELPVDTLPCSYGSLQNNTGRHTAQHSRDFKSSCYHCSEERSEDKICREEDQEDSVLSSLLAKSLLKKMTVAHDGENSGTEESLSSTSYSSAEPFKKERARESLQKQREILDATKETRGTPEHQELRTKNQGRGRILSKDYPTKKKIMTSVESQIASDEKGAQERLQGLLDEQGVIHAQVQAELEKGNVDRQKLQDLLEVEKSKHTVPEQGLKAEQAAQVKPGQESEDYEKSCNEHNCSPPIQVADQIESEVKRTEERLRILLSDKASLDLKFKEELEQGNNDRKRLQHLLEVEKAKLEASEKVLKDVGLNCVMFLNKAAHDPKQNDVLEKNRITAVPVAMEHDETQGISTVELEKQPRIEENESIFNNSAETAEENSSHHLKNVIEMEEFEKLLGTDTFLGIIAVLQDDEKEILAVEKRVRVQLEMEKCKHRTSYTSSQDSRKMMSDPLVIDNSEPRTGSLKKFASLSLQPEFFKGWDDMVPAAVANDSKSRTESVNDTSSARSDESCNAMMIDMDIVPLRVDSQNHVTETIIQLQSEKFQQWVEDEEAERLSLLPLSQKHQNLDQFHPQDGFSLGGAALEAPENRNVDMKPVTIMVTNGFMSRSESDEMIIRPPVDVTEDQRALSLSMESSAQGKELFRVSHSHLDDSETGHSENAPCFSWQTRDILYPLSVRLNSATGPDQELVVLKSKEHMESTRWLHGGAGRNEGHLDLYNSLHTSEDNTSDHCEEIFLGDEEAKEDEKLKKAKAKLHILVHEQEMAWRMAEDALENMNQRLKRLEAHKVRLQETTIRKLHGDQDKKNMDVVVHQLETKTDDYPSGFTSFYKSPVYEESKEASEVDCSHVTRGQLPLMILPGNSDESQVTVWEDNISASSEKHDDLQKDRGQQKSVHSPQKSSSCFLAGGASPGSGKQAISFEAPSDLFDDQIDDHDDSWSWLYTDHRDWKDILAVADETAAEDEMTFDIQQTVEKLLSSLVETDHPHMLISGSPIAKPGGMWILKNIVHKLTCVLHEQQNKLATFKVIAGKRVDNEPHILDLCDIYHELLKEMSCELGSFHHELQFGISKEIWVGQESLMSESKEKENFELQVDEAEHRLNLLHQKLGADSNNAMKLVKEHESQIQRKEKSFKYAKELNQQLVENMSKVEAMLAELRCHNKDLLAPLESRLNDTQHDVESLEDTCNKLQKELELSQLRATKLEEALHVKETEIQDTTQKMAVIQQETNAITLEKLEFLTMIQGLRHEAEQQQKHLLEVMNINQELLDFSEKKENEVTQLNKQVANLQQNLLLERPHDLLLERAQVTASEALNEMKDVCEEGETIQLHNKLLQSKLEETEYELAAREEALENLTQHLALTIEGQDSILQEKEQLQLSLNNAHYKEYRMDEQVRKSKTIIEELEVKLASMEGEVRKVRTEAMEMHKKTHEFFVVQREAKEMGKRVLELEEEIMEKEGQICILKSSLQSMHLGVQHLQRGLKASQTAGSLRQLRDFSIEVEEEANTSCDSCLSSLKGGAQSHGLL